MAHYLAGKDGDVGIQSEKIDDYQYALSAGAAGSSRWYNEYQRQLVRCRDALTISPASMTGVAHEDAPRAFTDHTPRPEPDRQRERRGDV